MPQIGTQGNAMTSTPEDAVAITGMACRFPGAPNVRALWRNTLVGSEHVSRTLGDDGALDWVRAQIGDYEDFDHELFGISRRDALTLDPQHRLFLECAWEALEDAGRLGRGRIARTGVFASANYSGYRDVLAQSDIKMMGLELDNGTDKDSLATRVAYHLNLQGTSLTVQTACSSSLVAVHLACQALLDFDVDQTLAGGVSMVLPDAPGWRYEPAGIHSGDGVCRPFDARADGTVMGDGAGVVVLRRLEDAVADNDHIYAVVLGSAVNNDGSRKVGFVAPSHDGQTEVILEAFARADVQPDQVSYLEAHGTGTPLGDRIELQSLATVFGPQRGRRPCRIGSIKGAIGHLDTASGVAGLIRAGLALSHRIVPSTVNHGTPRAELSDSFTVPTTCVDWEAKATRRAAVTSLGVGGTNAHVVLQEPPDRQPVSRERSLYPVLASAQTPQALDDYKQRLASDLREGCGPIDDIAYTLAVGREHFSSRAAVIARTAEQAAERLCRARAATDPAPAPRLIFAFPGQGTRLVDAGRALYDDEPVFTEHFNACAELVEHAGGPALLQAMETYYDRAQLDRTSVAQPLLVSLQYALTALLSSWGIHPQACVGHSLGEISAALAAGYLDLTGALDLAVRRGASMEEAPPGAMLVVGLPESEVTPLIPRDVTVAAVNSPCHTVVSGPRGPVRGLCSSLRQRGVRCEIVQERYAFHTPLMERAAAALGNRESVPVTKAPLPWLSGLTGTWASEVDGGYWRRHAVAPVRFSDCLEAAAATHSDILVVDLGPDNVLARAAIAHRQRGIRAVACQRHRDACHGLEALTVAVAALWERGVDVEWEQVLRGSGRRVPLATYPFQRRRCWPNPAGVIQPRQGSTVREGGRPRTQQGMELRVAAWREMPRPALADHPRYSEVLLLAGPGPASREIKKQLEAALPHTLTVKINPQAVTALASDGSPATRPGLARDLRSALERGHTAPPQAGRRLVVCALAVDVDGVEETPAVAYDTLLKVVKTVRLENSPLAGTDVLVVTRESQHVLGTEAGDPGFAALSGLARVVSQECPRLRVRVVDLESGPPEDLADTVLAEATTHVAEPLAAVRGARRWVRRYEPWLPPETTRPASQRAPAPPRPGADVVVGATGLIGGAAARVLAAGGGRTIVLVQHAAGRDNPGRVAARLDQLSAAGVAVEVEAVDAGGPRSVRALIRRTLDRHGAIGTLVHAAGISGESAYQPLATAATWEAERHFRAKVTGLAALADAVEGQPVSRVVLMSSLAAVLGAVNLGPYAAAAAVMDAYASRAQGAATSWISIGWDAWRDGDTWASQAEKRMRTGGLTVEAAEHAMRSILTAASAGHFLASRPDFDQRWERHVAGVLASPVENHPTLVRNADDSPEETDIPDLVLRAWRRCLADERLEPDHDLFARGADSLAGLEALEMIGGALGIELPSKLVFEATTPRSLAARVEKLTRFGVAHAVGREPEVRSWNRRGPVVWLMHPVSGDADCYEPLARILEDHRCRAVAGVALPEVPDDETIEELAGTYRRLLEDEGPPEVVCGWSYGGVLGMEVAQQVYRASGARPHHVVLDIPAPPGVAERSVITVTDAELLAAVGTQRAHELQRDFTFTVGDLERLDPADAFTRVLTPLREQRVFPRAFPELLARRLVAGYRRRIMALEQYRPPRYPGRVTLIRASEPEYGDSGLMQGVFDAAPDDDSWGWKRLATGGCVVHTVEGHHADILTARCVGLVADVVRSAAATHGSESG
ncbi:MAG: SDR family NAD(P)-dependent oxidoreductase [Nocardioidaceae bacterium]